MSQSKSLRTQRFGQNLIFQRYEVCKLPSTSLVEFVLLIRPDYGVVCGRESRVKTEVLNSLVTRTSDFLEWQLSNNRLKSLSRRMSPKFLFTLVWKSNAQFPFEWKRSLWGERRFCGFSEEHWQFKWRWRWSTNWHLTRLSKGEVGS